MRAMVMSEPVVVHPQVRYFFQCPDCFAMQWHADQPNGHVTCERCNAEHDFIVGSED
jgi:ribosomal protein S27E